MFSIAIAVFIFVMNIGQLLQQVPPCDRSVFRVYEKTLKKIESAESAVIFNERCLCENLLPNYTQDQNIPKISHLE